MSDTEIKTHYDQPTTPGAPEPPETPVDSGSQALDEALRSSFFIVKLLMVILVIVFAFSGMTTVGPQERAIKLRFGKAVGTGEEQLLKPGLHWAFPYPIDEIVPVRVGEIQIVTSSVGWYSLTRDQELAGQGPPALPQLNPAAEGYVLTADTNIVHARATLRYRIRDPLAYEFNFLNASNIVQNVLNNALFYASARSTVDDVLVNNAGFQEKVIARVKEQVDQLQLGITLEPGAVQVVVPAYVNDAFKAVSDTDATANTIINTAQGKADQALSAARAEATAMINTAESERARFVQEIASQANAFSKQLPQYQANPELFRQRVLVETWQRALTNVQEKFFLPVAANGKPQELRLLLSREPQKSKQPESQGRP